MFKKRIKQLFSIVLLLALIVPIVSIGPTATIEATNLEKGIKYPIYMMKATETDMSLEPQYVELPFLDLGNVLQALMTTEGKDGLTNIYQANGVKVLSASLDVNGVAEIDLSSEMNNITLGSSGEPLIIPSLVKTLSHLEEVKEVKLTIEGEEDFSKVLAHFGEKELPKEWLKTETPKEDLFSLNAALGEDLQKANEERIENEKNTNDSEKVKDDSEKVKDDSEKVKDEEVIIETDTEKDEEIKENVDNEKDVTETKEDEKKITIINTIKSNTEKIIFVILVISLLLYLLGIFLLKVD